MSKKLLNEYREKRQEYVNPIGLLTPFAYNSLQRHNLPTGNLGGIEVRAAVYENELRYAWMKGLYGMITDGEIVRFHETLSNRWFTYFEPDTNTNEYDLQSITYLLHNLSTSIIYPTQDLPQNYPLDEVARVLWNHHTPEPRRGWFRRIFDGLS